VVPDIRPYASLCVDDPRRGTAILRFHEDLTALLAAVQNGEGPPEEFFVPDLLGVSALLPPEDASILEEAWHLGHDLGQSVYAGEADHDAVRHRVSGALYAAAETGAG
jgi:hypothetical protein